MKKLVYVLILTIVLCGCTGNTPHSSPELNTGEVTASPMVSIPLPLDTLKNDSTREEAQAVLSRISNHVWLDEDNNLHTGRAYEPDGVASQYYITFNELDKLKTCVVKYSPDDKDKYYNTLIDKYIDIIGDKPYLDMGRQVWSAAGEKLTIGFDNTGVLYLIWETTE